MIELFTRGMGLENLFPQIDSEEDLDIPILKLFRPSPMDDSKIPPTKTGKKTLILDMDETLIHTSDFPPHSSVESFSVNANKYIFKRPGLDRFLTETTKIFDTFIFTAGTKNYADPILDHICPQISDGHRLFRDHCDMDHGRIKKNICKFNRSMNQVIIVDDSKAVKKAYPDNCITITKWSGNPNDFELTDIILPTLRECALVDDVREIISATGNKKLQRHHSCII